MKKIILYILLFLTASCQRSEIPLYSGTAGIYFEVYNEPTAGVYVRVDTSVLTFAYHPEKTDSIFALSIRVKGDTVPKDRQFSIKVIDTSANAAKAGIHYEAFPTTAIVPAGKASVLLPVKFLKHRDMQVKTFALCIQLLENENFKTDLPQLYVPDTKKYISATVHTILVDDALARPKYWLDGYLGPYSRKKYVLLCQLLDIPVATLNNTISVGTVKYYGNFMKNYLADEAAAGRIVYEEDGSVMKMGDGL
ncbi:DUF4843 domain-containing protein [Chitinophaga niabensis]|uniref:DUF4843 domain-containing protein n=1 Tax=Chitinophaga niabensis TaxID=536979 RepID=A0A1N6K4D7_9BACT|nr:DUF4843 domain-containing protein [Chitinophaga niabensis]SIO51425.1 protein of unknown function [Chitinophaga niabensis]